MPMIDDNGMIREMTAEEIANLPTDIPETEEISQDEINLDFDFRLSCLELGI